MGDGRLNLLVGGSMIVGGSLTVFGSLTGRLPAILAAIFKPKDLVATPNPDFYVPPGGVTVQGNAAAKGTDLRSSQDTYTALVQRAHKIGLFDNPDFKAAFDRRVVSLLPKQGLPNLKTVDKMTTELRNLIATYSPGSVADGTKTKSGSSLDPSAGRAPILAPPLGKT